jgi:hypothetical protein
MGLPGLSFEIVRDAGPVLGIRADQTAMIALTERGPREAPTVVYSIDEFTAAFGAPLAGTLAALEAKAYFDNGGQWLIVARFVPPDTTQATGTVATVGATQVLPRLAVPFVARDPGSFGNRIGVETATTVRRRSKGTLQAANQIAALNPPLSAADVGAPVRVVAGAPATVQWGKAASISPDGTSLVFAPGAPATAPPYPPPLPATAVAEVYEPSFTLTIQEPARADAVVPGLDLRDLDAARTKLAATNVTLAAGASQATDVELPQPTRTILSGGEDGLGVIPPDAGTAAGSFPMVGASAPGFVLPLAARDPGAAGNGLTVATILTATRCALGALVAIDADGMLHMTGLVCSDLGSPARLAIGTPPLLRWGTVVLAAGSPAVRPGTPFAPPWPLPQLANIQIFAPTFAVRIGEAGQADVTVSGLDLRDLDAARAALAPTKVTIPAGTASTLDPELPRAEQQQLAGGTNGTPLATRVAGLAASFARCIDALEITEQPDLKADIVIAPDLWSATWETKGTAFLAFDPPTAIALADQMVLSAWRSSDRVVLLDPPLGADLRQYSPTELVAWRADRAASLQAAAVGPLAGLVSAGTDFAAAFAPWVRIVAGGIYRGDDTLLVPPSGYVAGRMARTSRERGPWIATGNVSLEDVVGVADRLSVSEQELLQDAGLSPLRIELPQGATIQGVRSLSWPDRRPWGFLSTRRLFNFLRRAILPIGLSYTFESNSPATWLALRRDLTRLLRDLFLRGAFAGGKQSDAFFVRVDQTLNPPDAQDAGVLTCMIGVAPAVPLEFLLVRLIVQQNTATVTEAPP